MDNLKFGDYVMRAFPPTNNAIGRVIALGSARTMDGSPLQVTVQWRPGFVELVDSKDLAKVE